MGQTGLGQIADERLVCVLLEQSAQIGRRNTDRCGHQIERKLGISIVFFDIDLSPLDRVLIAAHVFLQKIAHQIEYAHQLPHHAVERLAGHQPPVCGHGQRISPKSLMVSPYTKLTSMLVYR